MEKGILFTTSHGCSCDPQWRYLIDGSVLAGAVAVQGRRGNRKLVRVIDRGDDPTHLVRLCAAVMISGISLNVQGLSFTYASDSGDPNAPRTFWLFSPQAFDMEGFIRRSIGGDVPETLELESWTKAKFNKLVAKTKGVCMNSLDMLVNADDIHPIVVVVVQKIVGLECEFIWSMVVGEAEKWIRRDRRYLMATLNRGTSGAGRSSGAI